MPIFTYNAIVCRQRKTAKQVFCVFSAKVGEVQSWARVDRLTPDNKAGVQRQKKDSRVDAIARFMQVDERNTIPTSIVIALPLSATNFSDTATEIDTTIKNVELRISFADDGEAPGLIIDGQHRIFGLAKFDPSIPVNIVAIVGPADDEIAFQFLVINNKVTKVSSDHIKALKLEYSDSQLDARLTKSARIKTTGTPAHLEIIDTEDTSPFKGKLKWPRNSLDPKSDPGIPPNAFEVALLHIANKRIDRSEQSDTPNPDFVVDVFLSIWRTIQETWPALWTDGSSKLLTKVGVICFTQYVVNTIVGWADAPRAECDLTDLNNVSDLTKQVLEKQEMAFWTTAWDATSLDTKSGWQTVLNNLERIHANKRGSLPWTDGVTLTKTAAVGGE